MAELTFMESMKDKMSRVGSNAFSEYVEEATSELLLAQDPEKVSQLVHIGNQGGEHIGTLLNAVRRRIDNKKAKVQCYTLNVIDALVRRCGRDLHRQLCDQKGLLRDMVLIAALKEPSNDAEFRAKELAGSLLLNWSFWFADHPEEKIASTLSQLANHARVAGASFEGLTPNRDFKPRLDESTSAGETSINGTSAASSRGAGAGASRQRPHQPSRQQRQQFADPNDNARRQQLRRQHVVVDAIPIKCPEDEKLAGMMEAVILMGEFLSQTEQDEAAKKGVLTNELLNTVAQTVRRDHELVSELLGTGIEIDNRETLLSINDSQVSVLQRHTELTIAAGGTPAGGTGGVAGGVHPAAGNYDPDAEEARAIAASLAEYEQQQRAQQQQQQQPATGSTGGAPASNGATTAAATNNPAGSARGPDAVAPDAPHMGTYRERLTRYYEFYNPEKMGDVDKVLEKFAGREENMLTALRAKYGDEPMPPQQQQQQVAPPASSSPPAAPSSAGASAPSTVAAPAVASSSSASGAGGGYRERLIRFYEFYNPEKIADVDKVLEKFAGREEAMIRQLRAKYGDEPAPPHQQQQQEKQPSVAAATVLSSSQPMASGPAPAPQPQAAQAQQQQQPAAPSIDDLFSNVQSAPQQPEPASSSKAVPQPAAAAPEAFDPFAEQPAWSASESVTVAAKPAEAPPRPRTPEMHPVDAQQRQPQPASEPPSSGSAEPAPLQTIAPVEPATPPPAATGATTASSDQRQPLPPAAEHVSRKEVIVPVDSPVPSTTMSTNQTTATPGSLSATHHQLPPSSTAHPTFDNDPIPASDKHKQNGEDEEPVVREANGVEERDTAIVAQPQSDMDASPSPAAVAAPTEAAADDLAFEESEAVAEAEPPQGAPPQNSAAAEPAVESSPVDDAVAASTSSDSRAARTAGDVDEAPPSAPPAPAATAPKKKPADDDDFDAFLNSRLK